MVFQIYGLNITLYENTKLPKWSPNNSCVTFFSYGTYFVCLSVFSNRMWFYQSRDLVCLVRHWFHTKAFHQMFRNYWGWGWGGWVCVLPWGFPRSLAGCLRGDQSLPGSRCWRGWDATCTNRQKWYISFPLMQASELESWPVFQDPDYCQRHTLIPPPRTLPRGPTVTCYNTESLQSSSPGPSSPFQAFCCRDA